MEKALETMKADDLFWQYWKKRWPHSTCNEKILNMSANFRETKAAFMAGYKACKDNQRR